jgi:Mlc titration factor MtfA (ptsG expression regulator)
MVYVILFLGLLVLAVLGFSKLKRAKAEPFPKDWNALLEDNVKFYNDLRFDEKKRFKKRIMLFLSEVHIEGVKTDIEDLDKILIASSAIIPVFGFKEWYYNNLSGVIVYPDTFNHDLQFSNKAEKRQILGMVGNGQFEKQMILSRRAIRQSFKNESDKLNTPVHEFVHLIDKTDDQTDGIPEAIMKREYIEPWLELMHKEMEAINNNKSDIRNYATTNEAEFFAVASEYFFERPRLFKKKHPELYKMLRECFQQNPADKK